MHPIQTVQYIMHLEFRNMDVTFPKTLQVNRMGIGQGPIEVHYDVVIQYQL